MDTLQAIYRFLDTIATIIRNYKDLKTRFYYIFVFIKLKLVKSKKYTYFQKNKIYFSNYESFVASLTEIFFYKSYFFETKSSSPVIIDCGANIGITSLYFKSIYPQARITNIEAVPNTFKILKKNTKSFSDLTNINTVVCKNVRSEKQVRIPSGKDNNDLNFSVFNGKPNKTHLKSSRLSDFVTEKTDCLILDIEGNEDQILLDLKENDKLKFIKNIFVEFHNYENKSLSRIISILSNNGFKIITGSGVRPPYSFYIDKFYSLPMYAYKI